MWLLACKLVFGTILTAIFITFFGHPSYVKYQKSQTFISEKRVRFNLLKPPAITFVTSTSPMFKGWKMQNDDEKWTNLETMCNTSIQFNELIQCMNKKTFKLGDIIEKASGSKTRTNLTDANYWKEGLDLFQAGKSFSLNQSYSISADSPHLEFYLKKNRTHFVFIHDPAYFVYTINPDTMPAILLGMENPKSTYIYLRAVYHHMLDKPGQHCESSDSYIFTACIKNSISRKIGCRLEWDAWSSKDIPLCCSVAEVLRFEEEYVKL